MLQASRVCVPGLGGQQQRQRDEHAWIEVKAKVAHAPLAKLDSRNDPLACVFVSIAVLRKLQVINQKWAEVATAGGKHSALARVVATRSLGGATSRDDDDAKLEGDAVVALNPIMAFNLGLRPGVSHTIRMRRRFFGGATNEQPPIAARVTIARVRSPASSGHAEYGPALREYFSVPRLVRKFDVLAIPIRDALTLEGCESGVDIDLDDDEIELSNEDAGEGGPGGENHGGPEAFEDYPSDFSVCVDSALDAQGRELPSPHSVVYFQVTELSATLEATDTESKTPAGAKGVRATRASEEGMLVDGVGGNTMLTQAGAVNSRVPDASQVLDFHFAEPARAGVRGAASGGDDAGDQLSLGAEGVEATTAQKELLKVLRVGTNPRLMRRLKRLSVMLHGAKGTGKRHMIAAAAAELGFHVYESSLTPLRGLPEDRAAKKLRHILHEATQVAPCIVHLRHLQALAPLAQGSEKPDDPEQVANVLKSFSQRNCLLVASTQSAEDVPTVIRGCFTHEVSIEAPDKDGRLAILEFLTDGKIRLASDVSLESLAVRTAGRTANELRALFANAACAVANQAASAAAASESAQTASLEEAWSSVMVGANGHALNGSNGNGRAMTEASVADEDVVELSQAVIDEALEALPSAAAMDIGAPKIPQVYWKDVGGLGHAKDEIMDMVQLPLQHPELFASGMRQRSGILLYGPPGTGKTLLAKAVATECNLNFISVKGPELLDMYIGESERKVRQVFETARSAKPCVLFFDELDSLAPQRGRGADSGGVMDRVVSQLLTEIDGMQGNADVFVIGATNRPDLLDQSLLRPGRFDRLIYLGISRDRDAQLKIVKALSRKFVLDQEVDLDALVDRCPFNFTGADFYALCSGAMANALQRRVREIQELIRQHPDSSLTARKYLATLSEDELQVTVKMTDYLESLQNTVASVSEDEIRHYESLRDKFSSAQQQDANRHQEEENHHAVNGGGKQGREAKHDEDPAAPHHNGDYLHANGNGDANGYVKDMVRLCPHCKTPTLKEGGCDAMVCPVCTKEWSWEKDGESARA
ncbi:26S proteasome regulatory subunit 7 [Hondaea fermentalgiana]|uniref:Peroxisomal ATPase PEX6 n=1 Tax=Hondaea fermentalgiana TaxID=2315210 RepID=A0A2R5GNQ2_9STRA|nr:26S proteasome regulatory subunit 7 [Hondaea fermentalgiana]|eukprot:GBG31368.1 26S proteasome regulatory subunit 7 [Hondaea fermentalgiana]